LCGCVCCSGRYFPQRLRYLCSTSWTQFRYLCDTCSGTPDQRAKGIDEYLGKVLFQYLIIMCDEVEKNCPTVWPGVSKRLSWPVDDPSSSTGSAEERLAGFRAARDRIEEMVRAWVSEADL